MQNHLNEEGLSGWVILIDFLHPRLYMFEITYFLSSSSCFYYTTTDDHWSNHANVPDLWV